MTLTKGTENPAALVLAAGLGTRLQPLTCNLAKPAVPFLGRPLIHYSLKLLYEGGLRRICVNLHHHPRSVRQSVQSWLPPDVELRFSEEPEILGTGGAIRQAARYLSGADFFIVINGKIYFEQDLKPVIEHHLRERHWVTMVVVPHSGSEPFNPVILDSDLRVERFALLRELKDFSRAAIYTGLQIVSREVLELIPEGFSDTVKDIYPTLIAEGRRVGAFVSPAFWCESSTPLRYLENSLRVAARGADLGEVIYDPFREVVAAPDLHVEKGVELSRLVAWQGVRIGSGCSIRNAVICDGCQVPRGCRLENVVIVPGKITDALSNGAYRLGDCLVAPLG